MWIVHAMVVELCGVRCVRFVSNFRARLDRERAVLDLVGFVIDVSVHRVGRPRRQHAAPAPHAASPSARHRPYIYPIGRRGASEDERVIRQNDPVGSAAAGAPLPLRHPADTRTTRRTTIRPPRSLDGGWGGLLGARIVPWVVSYSTGTFLRPEIVSTRIGRPDRFHRSVSLA